MCTKHKF